MGYDITAGKSRKLMDMSYDNYLCHIQCQYSYKELLNKSFGFDFTSFKGRITKANKQKFIIGIDNMVENLKDPSNHKKMYLGYLSNISPDEFITELLNLKYLIESEQVKYLSVH